MLPKTFSKALLGAFWEHFWDGLGGTWVALGGSLAYFLSILLRVAFLLDLGVPPTPLNLGSAARGKYPWHYFSQMVAARAVRKGGIIKGVWLPRVALTP